MSADLGKGRFSPRTLLTSQDYSGLVALREGGPAFTWPLRLLASGVGRRYLGRVVLSGVGWLLAEPIKWLAVRIQGARSPGSPFFWLQWLIRLGYKLVRRGRPLSEAQEAHRREAAGALHPDARRYVLAIGMFRARLPHNWAGQYTAFGEVALRAEDEQPDLDLIRHEWAHYWWFHHMTAQEQAAYMEAVAALALGPDVPGEMQPAQEIARAYVEGRDARCRKGEQTLVIPLQSNDGYRLAACFGLFDLEVYAYVAQLCGGDAGRLPAGLRPFYKDFFLVQVGPPG